MNDPSQANLDWLAFQYVTDSLNQSERDRFEQQMLKSQESREAVARAVELALATDFACRSAVATAAAQSRKTQRTRVRRWAWSAMAASLMFVVGWQASVWFLGRDLNGAFGPDVADSEPGSTGVLSVTGRDLALAWDQMRQTFTLAELDREFPELTVAEADALDDQNDAPLAMADVSMADGESPSWMLAAVAGMKGGVAENAPPEDSSAAPVSPSDTRDEG